MKIRSGFVSNSSSSSFLIYGVAISTSELRKLLAAKTGRPEEEFEDDTGRHFEKSLPEKSGLTIHHPFYDDFFYIGIEWDEVKDDETGKQFKERVEKLIEESFGEKLECSTLSQAWYNG